MKKLPIILFFGGLLFMFSCEEKNTHKSTTIRTSTTSSSSEPKEEAVYDPTRGEGKFDESNVSIASFDGAMATKGKAIATAKCFSCHKITDEKLVGPGWKGVTDRRTPYWIMNFITNPDPMIDKDPEVQEQLEICLVRMPNQNLGETDARSLLEYMRQIDGAK